MVKAVVPQHWASFMHCSSAPQLVPRGSALAQASMLGAPEGWGMLLETMSSEAHVAAAAGAEVV